MRKVTMKRRGRPSKVDSSTDDNNKDDFEANGDISNDKNTSKRKSRSRHTEENGKEEDSSEDRSAGGDTTNGENESSDEPETKKRKSGGKKVPAAAANESDDEADAKKGKGKKGDDGSEEEHETKKKKASKKAAQSKKAASKDDEDDDEDEEDEENYEVEAIINDKKVGSTRHYLIRWKGYGSDSDTWEPEKTLNCFEMLQEYKDNKAKKKKTSEEFDENKDYEVDRILEVHFKRDGKREFLVVWKGYPATESTWEPEENMACPDLVARFMSKVEKAKTVDQRALRPFRAPTERFTLTTKDTGRRISKRNSNKQRVRYVDCE